MAEPAEDVAQLLSAIEDTQNHLMALYRTKREAIRRAKVDDLDRLTETERFLVSQLRAHLECRRQLLQRINATGGTCRSLEEFVETLDVVAREGLLGQIRRTQRTADVLRRESWVLWIVSQQTARLFAEILELFANGGRRAPVYSARPDAEKSIGGAILDASA